MSQNDPNKKIYDLLAEIKSFISWHLEGKASYFKPLGPVNPSTEYCFTSENARKDMLEELAIYIRTVQLLSISSTTSEDLRRTLSLALMRLKSVHDIASGSQVQEHDT